MLPEHESLRFLRDALSTKAPSDYSEQSRKGLRELQSYLQKHEVVDLEALEKPVTLLKDFAVVNEEEKPRAVIVFEDKLLQLVKSTQAIKELQELGGASQSRQEVIAEIQEEIVKPLLKTLQNSFYKLRNPVTKMYDE